jgi:hypothetical protein
MDPDPEPEQDADLFKSEFTNSDPDSGGQLIINPQNLNLQHCLSVLLYDDLRYDVTW